MREKPAGCPKRGLGVCRWASDTKPNLRPAPFSEPADPLKAGADRGGRARHDPIDAGTDILHALFDRARGAIGLIAGAAHLALVGFDVRLQGDDEPL